MSKQIVHGDAVHATRAAVEDLLAAGVIDPTQVVRLALQNAASIATLLLTTEAMVCEAPKTASGTSDRQAED